MKVNDLFMKRCLELARGGRGLTAPNPMVGAVIVCGDTIIGEGFHRCHGEAHAEVNAINSVKNKELLKDSTLYVNLEPCSHYGKTPPCAELIIKSGIPRVAIASLDPYPEVSGRGVKMLQNAGTDVVTGILEHEAITLNRYFMTAHSQQRPFVILKWAQSRDGFIDRTRRSDSEKPVRFSSSITQIMLHKLRSDVQAIMVGTNTAVLDNPELTVRLWNGKSPLRIVIDRHQRIPENSKLLDGKYPTLVISNHSSVAHHVEYVKIPESPDFLKIILSLLYRRGINSVLVEGGANLHNSFIKNDLWDEIRIETAPFNLEAGVRAADIKICKDLTLSEREMIPFYCKKGADRSLLEVYKHSSFH
jgi:diaminohydroxyphosphoribosylaminopyrimidine deaminase/5-amino-6-(5-phosphoribosylamino)uracil reductase